MLRFQRQYFILTIILFLIEVLIAMYAHDKIVRPYIGDFLVVILLYCFLKSFLTTSVFTTAVSVLLFSYTIETLQYFNLVDRLGLHHSRLATIIIGSSFEWIDLVAYTAGIAVVLYIEKLRMKKQPKEIN
jgi:Rad3-related DNA helicase